jgi:hypothetical protein
MRTNVFLSTGCSRKSLDHLESDDYPEGKGVERLQISLSLCNSGSVLKTNSIPLFKEGNQYLWTSLA